MSDETANDRDLVELTMEKAHRLSSDTGPNSFKNEPIVKTLLEVLEDTGQKSAAILTRPALKLADLELDRAIHLRWTLRDIRAKRTILSPVSPDELRILLEMGLIEMRNDVAVLTNEGDRVLD
jgi:hypothetical protein